MVNGKGRDCRRDERFVTYGYPSSGFSPFGGRIAKEIVGKIAKMGRSFANDEEFSGSEHQKGGLGKMTNFE